MEHSPVQPEAGLAEPSRTVGADTEIAVPAARTPVKVSRYTRVFHYPDGLALAYNTLTGRLVDLSGDDGQRIAAALADGGSAGAADRHAATARDRDALVEMGFLVEQDVEEVRVVREIWRRGQRKKGASAMLTILPTLSCNFDCPYCFERHIKGTMSAEVQDALVRFTETRLLPRTNGLSIEWFGGEPLVGLAAIESLTERFRAICARKKLPAPTASVTTNGYLLSPKMYAKLLALGITSAQVTLDGPPDIHNRRRPLAGGRPSFDKVIANIKNAPDGFSISIRINVDAGNKDHVFDLLELLHREGILAREMAYIAKVESFSQECRSSEGVFLSSQEYAQFKYDLMLRCRRAGIPWASDDAPRLVAYGFCIVDQPKGFVVQPDGKLLKCWAEAGNATGFPVAHLLQEETWRHLAVSPLQSRDPFDDEECLDCSLLPACMGGCPRIRENLRHRGEKRCPPLRYSLANEVLALYRREKSATPAPPQRLSI